MTNTTILIASFSPLHRRGAGGEAKKNRPFTRTVSIFRVIDGDRTHDNQNHNLGLYQLSYDHRFKKRVQIK